MAARKATGDRVACAKRNGGSSAPSLDARIMPAEPGRKNIARRSARSTCWRARALPSSCNTFQRGGIALHCLHVSDPSQLHVVRTPARVVASPEFVHDLSE